MPRNTSAKTWLVRKEAGRPPRGWSHWREYRVRGWGYNPVHQGQRQSCHATPRKPVPGYVKTADRHFGHTDAIGDILKYGAFLFHRPEKS
jgi:hypothetical protein